MAGPSVCSGREPAGPLPSHTEEPCASRPGGPRIHDTSLSRKRGALEIALRPSRRMITRRREHLRPVLCDRLLVRPDPPRAREPGPRPGVLLCGRGTVWLLLLMLMRTGQTTAILAFTIQSIALALRIHPRTNQTVITIIATNRTVASDTTTTVTLTSSWASWIINTDTTRY